MSIVKTISSQGQNTVNQYTSDNGFTLIEVMIALVLLLVGMLGVISMQYYAIVGNTSSREVRIATTLTADSIEEVRMSSYTLMAEGNETLATTGEALYAGKGYSKKWWIVPNCVSITLTPNNNTCSAALIASCTPNSAALSVSAVRSRTCWQDKDGDWHSVSIDTIRGSS